MSPKISPCLWFVDQAEEAARFYTSLLPDSRISRVQQSPVDTPGGPAGSVLLVEFTLAGRPYMALNGGAPAPAHPLAVSFAVALETQEEIDRLWEALIADGGAPRQCGWLVDRYGFPWQVFPSFVLDLLGDPARGPRMMAALMEMVKLDVAALKAAAEG
ncbi:VOC family protein [Hansschlegelia beijingensis]|uniref:VOC family protein n=1 Tax=Hansschlegelia beijingensis TaxID=1133344 RepID=UPI00387F30FF